MIDKAQLSTSTTRTKTT